MENKEVRTRIILFVIGLIIFGVGLIIIQLQPYFIGMGIFWAGVSTAMCGLVLPITALFGSPDWYV